MHDIPLPAGFADGRMVLCSNWKSLTLPSLIYHANHLELCHLIGSRQWGVAAIYSLIGWFH